MAEWKDITRNYDPKCYGLIVEWKSEGPLIMEGKPMAHNEARQMAQRFEDNPRVIRVAIFKMQGGYWGNDTLIPNVEG